MDEIAVADRFVGESGAVAALASLDIDSMMRNEDSKNSILSFMVVFSEHALINTGNKLLASQVNFVLAYSLSWFYYFSGHAFEIRLVPNGFVLRVFARKYVYRNVGKGLPWISRAMCVQCIFWYVDHIARAQSGCACFFYLEAGFAFSKFFKELKAALSFGHNQDLVSVVSVEFCFGAFFKIDMVDEIGRAHV